MSERNQCDGCALGMAVNENGNHVNASGRIHMGCTRDRYEASETEQLRARVAEMERDRDMILRDRDTARSQLARAAEDRDEARARAAAAERERDEARRRVAELEEAIRTTVDTASVFRHGCGRCIDYSVAFAKLRAALSGTVSTIDTTIDAAVRAEREACQMACIHHAEKCGVRGNKPGFLSAVYCANAIRARGES